MFTIVLATPQFVVPMLPLMWVYLRAMQFYRPVARELKRLEPLARSPVYSEQQAAASGVALIRKLGLGHVMAARALSAIDGNTAVVFAARAVGPLVLPAHGAAGQRDRLGLRPGVFVRHQRGCLERGKERHRGDAGAQRLRPAELDREDHCAPGAGESNNHDILIKGTTE